MAFPAVFDIALGTRDAAVWWDTFVPIVKNLGDFRYLQIQGNDYGAQGPISSSGSTVFISTPLDIMYCHLSGPMRTNDCTQVPPNQILDHRVQLETGGLRFERP